MNVSTLQGSEDNQAQMLQNIAALQDMEKGLYKQLEAAPPAVSTTYPKCSIVDDAIWSMCGDTKVKRWTGASTKTDGTAQATDNTNIGNCNYSSGKEGSSFHTPCPSTDPSAEQEKIIQKINEISEMRIALFKNLTNTYGNMQNNVANSRTDLVDQMTLVGVVEEELDSAKSNLHRLTDAKNNKVRMSEINTYYGKRYSAHTGVMKILIMICIPLLILAILRKKNLVPRNIANGVSGLIVAIGAIILIRRIWDLTRRDNMNYDEYKWFFDPASQAPTVYNYDMAQLGKLGHEAKSQVGTLQDEAQNVANSLGLGCVGSACCSSGMTFDDTTGKCVESVSKETFQNGKLNKTSFIAPNDTVCLQPAKSVVQPFSAVDYASV